mgnify:CR=1 FL=1|jgi:hypothetical protein
MIVRFTAYTTSPRERAAASEKKRLENPEAWGLAGYGGPAPSMTSLRPDRTMLLEVPDELGWRERDEYCEEVAKERGWEIWEGSIDEVELETVTPWPRDRGIQVAMF